MIKHYAPDIPASIVPRTMASLIPGADLPTQISVLGQSIKLTDVMIIDFGGRLLSYKRGCNTYVDLSHKGNINVACQRLFETLRLAESPAMKDKGVRALLLPDLEEASNHDELTRALWERINRAASGTYLSGVTRR